MIGTPIRNKLLIAGTLGFLACAPMLRPQDADNLRNAQLLMSQIYTTSAPDGGEAATLSAAKISAKPAYCEVRAVLLASKETDVDGGIDCPDGGGQ